MGNELTAGVIRDLLLNFAAKNADRSQGKTGKTLICIDDLFQSQRKPMPLDVRATIVPNLELFRECIDSDGFVHPCGEWCEVLC